MASLLEKIHSPEDIKGFDGEELAALCDACTPAQLRVITELARAAKSAMEQQGFC